MKREDVSVPTFITEKVEGYHAGLPKIAYMLSVLGATDAQICALWGIATSTLSNWKRSHPELYAALNRGRVETDALVAESFLRCCIGYEYEQEEVRVARDGTVIKTSVKRYKGPDADACYKWLLARRADMGWSKTTTVDFSPKQVDMSDMSTDELKFLKRLGFKTAVDVENN